MEVDSRNMPKLREVMPYALKAAFLSAVEKAKQTDTPLILMEKGELISVPAAEIDAYLAEKGDYLQDYEKNKKS